MFKCFFGISPTRLFSALCPSPIQGAAEIASLNNARTKNAGGVLFHTNQRDNKIDILKPGKCQEAKGYSSKSMQTAKYYGTHELETRRREWSSEI